MKLFCFGLGHCGTALAAQLLQQEWKVAGTCRSEEKAEQLRRGGIEAYTYTFGGTESPLADLTAALADATHVLCTIAPTSEGDCVVSSHGQRLAASLSSPRLSWLGYLTSTAVYGNVDGAWVDETSSVSATSRFGKNRLLAEEQWAKIASSRDVPLSIFRVGGIYDRKGEMYERVKTGKAHRINKPGQYFNWIHTDDIVQTIVAAMNHKQSDEKVAIYNVVDDVPCPSRDIVEYTCDHLGMEYPPLQQYDEIQATMSPLFNAFYSQSRRVRNDKIKTKLGVKLKYPSYKHFLQQTVESDAK